MQDKNTKTGVITINLQALAENYQTFQDMLAPGCLVAGVVKANAYGLGIRPVAEKLAALKCPQFFVATLDEALQVRGFDRKTPVAVLGGLFEGAEEEYLNSNILPVLNSPDDIYRWRKLSLKKNKRLPCLLHFDTGMNRLGLSAAETNDLLNENNPLEGLDVKIIMSHFACADDNNHPLTKIQADRFLAIAKHFPQANKSLSNSSGLFRDKSFHYDLVRPGYSLYGGNPTPEVKNPVKAVASLSVKILQIRHNKKGESIGYGASHIFDTDTITATIGMGYADGFLRSNSAKATVYWKGKACPVLGRVSMDLVTVGLGHLGTDMPKAGESLEILGPNQDVDKLAVSAGTIGYEILTSLGRRYAREYI